MRSANQRYIFEDGKLERMLTENGYVKDDIQYFYFKDYQGNNRAIADSNGNIGDLTAYYPYGTPFGAFSGNDPYKYSSKELDTMNGLNLYDFAARQQDPTLGIFTSQDPLAGDYPTISPYAYCAANPVKYVDPTGMVIIDAKNQKSYPRLTEYYKNLLNLWNNKDNKFKTSFMSKSGLKNKQIRNILSWGNGPKINIKPLQGQNGNTMLNLDKKENKYQNIGSGKININSKIADRYEKAVSNKEIGSGELMIESTTFHELTHYGNAKTSHTANGNFTESGKAFEIEVYGEDVDIGNSDIIWEKQNPQYIPLKIVPISINFITIQ